MNQLKIYRAEPTFTIIDWILGNESKKPSV
jgi:hypothetical protein